MPLIVSGKYFTHFQLVFYPGLGFFLVRYPLGVSYFLWNCRNLRRPHLTGVTTPAAKPW
jgi:hypothetical protein